MIAMNPQFITDKKGKKISVVLSIKEYKSMVEELEDLEDIRLYDEAKASKEPSYPMEEAFKMVEAKKKKGR